MFISTRMGAGREMGDYNVITDRLTAAALCALGCTQMGYEL